jgi:hypothetical protein
MRSASTAGRPTALEATGGKTQRHVWAIATTLLFVFVLAIGPLLFGDSGKRNAGGVVDADGTATTTSAAGGPEQTPTTAASALDQPDQLVRSSLPALAGSEPAASDASSAELAGDGAAAAYVGTATGPLLAGSAPSDAAQLPVPLSRAGHQSGSRVPVPLVVFLAALVVVAMWWSVTTRAALPPEELRRPDLD